jgi:hypothetical protein
VSVAPKAKKFLEQINDFKMNGGVPADLLIAPHPSISPSSSTIPASAVVPVQETHSQSYAKKMLIPICPASSIIPTKFKGGGTSFDEGSMTLEGMEQCMSVIPLPGNCSSSWLVEVIKGDGSGCYIGVSGEDPSSGSLSWNSHATCCRWGIFCGNGWVGYNELSPSLSWGGRHNKFVVSLDPVSLTVTLTSPLSPPSFPPLSLPLVLSSHYYAYYYLGPLFGKIRITPH